MRPLSLRAQLTLWYTLILVVVLCLFGADILWMQGRLGVRRVDRELDGLTATLANLVRDELKEQSTAAAAAEDVVQTLAISGRAVAVLDARGMPLAATWNGFELHDLPPASPTGRTVWNATTAAGAWRVHAQHADFESTAFVLLAASPLADVRREQHEVQEAMLVGIPIALVCAAAGGLWLASIGLRPITAALQTQRQFMADASHELRTPVSVVRTAADVALGRPRREEADYRETLTIVADQSRRLSRLVDDMLVLARADAGGYPLRPVDLYLDDVIAECRRAVAVLAAERGVTIEAPHLPEIPFRGDEGLLRQLVLNVVQNAIQHTPPGGSVAIDVRQADDITVRVSDTGPGIAPADRARIFDRFVQLDAARRANGTGLGLPIAKWITEAHGGTLILERSGPTGSTFCISLPAQPALTGPAA